MKEIREVVIEEDDDEGILFGNDWWLQLAELNEKLEAFGCELVCTVDDQDFYKLVPLEKAS